MPLSSVTFLPGDSLKQRLKKAAHVAPSPAQLKWMRRGYIAFLHYSPNTFTNRQWGTGDEKPEDFCPESVAELSALLPRTGTLQLERGPYHIAAVMDENPHAVPLKLEGCLIDLYDPALPVYHATEVAPGLQGLYYNVKKAPKAPAILAAASREYEVKRSSSRFSYLCKGPRDTYNITRILLPARPASASVNGEPCPFEWDQDSRTVFLRFPNSPDGAKVELAW